MKLNASVSDGGGVPNNANGSDNNSSKMGLGHVLSGLYAHLSSAVISATMAWYLVNNNGSRFTFSHEFAPFLLSQCEAWLKGEPIYARLQISRSSGTTWMDSKLNDYRFRPFNGTFDNMSYWQFTEEYEMCLKSGYGNADEEDTDSVVGNDENKVFWEFNTDHPGKTFARLRKRLAPCIPTLLYNGDLPNLENCLKGYHDSVITDSVREERIQYATKALIMFWPF